MKKEQNREISLESKEALKIVFDQQLKIDEIETKYGDKDFLFRKMLEGACFLRDHERLSKEEAQQWLENSKPPKLP